MCLRGRHEATNMKSRKTKAQILRGRGRIADADADLTDEHLVSVNQACEVLGGCSRMHLWRLVNDETYKELAFPRPITIGKIGRHERKYFRLGEIRRWIARQAARTAGRAA
jgi:predicted DNA-binding transcriptional regulator AlpA